MAQRILLIRHAEKPPDDGSIAGVSIAGEQDPEELIVRGWQRAGALVQFFAAGDLRPDAIFASRVDPQSASLRPQHTVLPLADFMGMPLDLRFGQGEEEALVAALVIHPGTTLVAWEHKIIPKGIANRILGNANACPQKWPRERSDVVWIFERSTAADAWTFTQIPQKLLVGDLDSII